MADAVYVRGWDDCLEALGLIIEKSKDLADFKEKIEGLKKLIKEEKFDKIRYELGAFNLF